MSAPVLNGPFTMPMFRSFVPRRIRPWVYVFMACTFQLSGGTYLGALNHMVGEASLMREDIQMCLYANLAGMALYFPLLFRMKFRFTNKTLLMASAAGVLACNLVVPFISFLPLLWAVCFIEGICKIQGTFECMSNIQLWMTPKRDFTVFFPLLHIIILGCMQLSDLATTWLMYHWHWTYMHVMVSLLMLADLCILLFCIRHFRMMKKFPLFGIDWLGALLWAALLLQVAYLFDYGEWYDWWNSPVVQRLSVSIVFTLGICLWRMFTIRHPYIEPEMWTYRGLFPILALIMLVEMFLATEHVPEKLFCSEVMGYEEMVVVRLDWPALAGILCGCLFAYWWMHVRRYNYLRLVVVGFAALALYLTGFYGWTSADMHLSQLYVPVACRGFAYAVLSATFMTWLEELLTFRHFFQALSVFNMLHMVVGGVAGSALYSRMFAYYMADNAARYGAAADSVWLSRSGLLPGEFLEPFMRQVAEVSIKQIYGWVAYACLAVMLLFLLYDMPVRRQLKLMPQWKDVARQIKATYRRMRIPPESR